MMPDDKFLALIINLDKPFGANGVLYGFRPVFELQVNHLAP
jgi:hypothetical protein